MTFENLTNTINERFAKFTGFRPALEALSHSTELKNFIQQNQFVINTNVNDVVVFLVQKSLSLNANSIEVLANIFNEYSIMYIISMLGTNPSKSVRNELEKKFDLIINKSKKFSLYTKDFGKSRSKILRDSNDVVMEFYWLIPLFTNTEFLAKMTTSQMMNFIKENHEISILVPDYFNGYNFYVTGGTLSFNKTDYKQFLHDGLVSLNQVKSA